MAMVGSARTVTWLPTTLMVCPAHSLRKSEWPHRRLPPSTAVNGSRKRVPASVGWCRLEIEDGLLSQGDPNGRVGLRSRSGTHRPTSPPSFLKVLRRKVEDLLTSRNAKRSLRPDLFRPSPRAPPFQTPPIVAEERGWPAEGTSVPVAILGFD